jgi:hypothetical protein
MSKSFVCRRRPEATAVMMEVIDHCAGSVARAEKKHGRDGLKTLQASLILAAMYHVLENYEKAEPLLKGNFSAAKRKSVPGSRETVWASTMLAEAYFKTNRIGDAMLITQEARALCGSMDPKRNAPLLGAWTFGETKRFLSFRVHRGVWMTSLYSPRSDRREPSRRKLKAE